MQTPSGPPALAELYKRLQALFPGWSGQQARPSPSLSGAASPPPALAHSIAQGGQA